MSIPEYLLMMAEDRRQYRRSRIGLPVDIGLGRNTPVRYSGHTIDLSERGAVLDVTQSCVNGDFLTVRFLYPTIGEVTCNAIVRRTAAKCGVGVEFVNLTDQDQQRLGALAALGIN
ncbi:MAG: PilZ domain-containing protein [Gemmatimonadetes bacterium]|nr:PilZ domain-containing protein [Gemmatimonadota bacterium]